MAIKKAQPKPVKNTGSSMFDYQNIYSGDPKKHPGIAKAKADKVKAAAAIAVYKKKSDAAKVKAITVAKVKKKK